MVRSVPEITVRKTACPIIFPHAACECVFIQFILYSQSLNNLLIYSAVGCPDFAIPQHADMRREGDRVVVTCQADPLETWERKCVGTQWIGEVRTCAAPQGTLARADGPALPIGRRSFGYFFQWSYPVSQSLTDPSSYPSGLSPSKWIFDLVMAPDMELEVIEIIEQMSYFGGQ